MKSDIMIFVVDCEGAAVATVGLAVIGMFVGNDVGLEVVWVGVTEGLREIEGVIVMDGLSVGPLSGFRDMLGCKDIVGKLLGMREVDGWFIGDDVGSSSENPLLGVGA